MQWAWRDETVEYDGHTRSLSERKAKREWVFGGERGRGRVAKRRANFYLRCKIVANGEGTRCTSAVAAGPDPAAVVADAAVTTGAL